MRAALSRPGRRLAACASFSSSSSPGVVGKETLAGLSDRVSLSGKTVLVRADLNVPLDKETGTTITSDKRIRESLPTLRRLQEAGAKVVVCSHLGRPKGQVNDKMRLAPVAGRLGELLGAPVATADDCVGDGVAAAVAGLSPGDVLLLENVRFHAGEEKNDPAFTAELVRSIAPEVYVNDAFGTAHRAHATTAGVAAHAAHAVAGELLEKELRFLKGAVDSPERPLAAIVGGAKVSTKIPVLESLIGKCDKVLLGGGMIFTFYKAQGKGVGSSIVEEDMVSMAGDLMAQAEAAGVEFILPTDVLVTETFDAAAPAKVVPADAIPDGWMGLDIGTATVDRFAQEVASCRTVVWNGPMGVFEFGGDFARGTMGVAHALADLSSGGDASGGGGGTTIVGGGDSVAAVEASGLAGSMSHVSTGGGASLELLEGKVLPGVEALNDV